MLLMAPAGASAAPAAKPAAAGAAREPGEADAKAPAANGKSTDQAAKPEPAGKPTGNTEEPAEMPSDDPDDEAAAEDADAEKAAVARPVSAEPVQLFGWREYVFIDGVEERLRAKLDTGARTSSIHAEDIELFERDGKKWVRFIVTDTDPKVKKPARTRLEAPFVRIARVKEPGNESVAREVVRLAFKIGDRKLRGEFTLNNRSNMLVPVLIGRSMIKDLGWVDPGRAHLADQKIFR